MEANFHYTCLYEENINQKLGLESVAGKLVDICIEYLNYFVHCG